jgi:hypothetical protein
MPPPPRWWWYERIETRVTRVVRVLRVDTDTITHKTSFLFLRFIMAKEILNFHLRRGFAVTAGLLLLGSAQLSVAFTPPHRGECRFFLDTADTDEVRGESAVYLPR